MKTIKTTFLITAVFLLLTMSGCEDEFIVEGNGITQIESRYAGQFSKVTSDGDFQVIIMPGNEYAVEVTAESNLLPYIETTVEGNELKIHTRGIRTLQNQLPIEVFITTPSLKSLRLSGSGNIETGFFSAENFHILVSGSGTIKTNIQAYNLNATISGSGNIILTGLANQTNFTISGSGIIDAYDLPQKYCETNISGSGNAYVNAQQTINASISGSGNVFYINYPRVNGHISGSGKIINDN
jgi:hypothetical protein